jgi:hypothetical protein
VPGFSRGEAIHPSPARRSEITPDSVRDSPNKSLHNAYQSKA